TPGFLMLSEAYLSEQDGVPDEAEVREVMAANICRCTGYQGIVEAVRQVAEERAG
ncbi:(2Fe-2S)-binding protein, partial [Bacillus paralicheniformis]|nr:(2Fe-2S)-binding protein [Bacillus paralicheniformis]